MSVGKLAIATILMIFAGLLLTGCEGDDGPPGPPGLTGPTGPSGNNRSVPVPADRTFGIQVQNATSSDMRGAADVTVTFSSTATPSATQVVGALLETAPILDGVDDGSAEWGAAAASEITLGQVSGEDNGISSATVRFGYDLNYIYMQVVWTESATGNFVPSADTTDMMWYRDGNSWIRTYGEDQIWLLWDGAGSSTLVSRKQPISQTSLQTGSVWDVWLWQATVTGYDPHLRDLAVWEDAPEILYYDSGFDFIVDNSDGSLPAQMRQNSPVSGSPYPLRAFEAADYVDAYEWRDGAMIQGYVYFEPAGSLADVNAQAQYANGTWTLELRRARNTGNADDSVF